MKAFTLFVCSTGAMVALAGMARADDAADPAAYRQKMHDCTTQMKTDKPDMNHEARRKACRQQLGPAPKKAPAAVPATPPPPAAPETHQ